MIYEKFSDLIGDLVSKNGTAENELLDLVLNDKITTHEAKVVLFYVNLEKLSRKLDDVSSKLPG